LDKDLVKIFGKGAVVSLIGIISGRIFHFLGFVILARTMGPGEFGVFSLNENIVSILANICTIGLDRGVIHFLNKSSNAQESSKIILKALKASMAGSFGVILFFFLNYQFNFFSILTYQDFNQYLFYFSFVIVLNSLLFIGTAITRISLSMKYTFYYQYFGQPFLFFLIILILSITKLSLWNALLGLIISLVVVLIFNFRSVSRQYSLSAAALFKKNHVKGLLQFSFVTIFASSVTLLTTRFDRILLGILRNEYDVGIYQSISQISVLMALILGAFGSIVIPMVSKYYNENNFVQIKSLLHVSTKWSFYLAIPIFILFISIPDQIIEVVFGKEYLAGSATLSLLAFAQLINAGTGPIGPTLIMTNNQKPWLKIALFSLLLNVSINYLLIPKYSYWGNGISMVITMSMLYGSGLSVLYRKYKILPYNRNFLKGITSGIITFLILWLIKNNINIQDYFKVPFLVILCYALFILFLYLLKFDKEDRILIEMISKKTGFNR